MKLPRLITRRRLKWAGVGVSTLLVFAFINSIWCRTFLVASYPQVYASAGLHHGRLVLVWVLGQWGTPAGRDFAFSSPQPDAKRIRVRFALTRSSGSFATKSTGELSFEEYYVPLWIPFLGLFSGVVYLWYTDRRAKPWQCANCRYDLRGLEGVVCPECGERHGGG